MIHFGNIAERWEAAASKPLRVGKRETNVMENRLSRPLRKKKVLTPTDRTGLRGEQNVDFKVIESDFRGTHTIVKGLSSRRK